MQRIVNQLLLAAALVAITSTSNASQLSACNTAECEDYFNAYTILTKRGHSSAMATLGELYYSGYGTEQDKDKAFKWFRRAAKFGHTTAQYKAGIMYLQTSAHQDIDKGINLLKRSAKAAFSPSALALGKIYLQNTLTEPDLEEADRWLALAYKLNNLEAMKFTKALRESPDTRSLKLPKAFALVDAEKPIAPDSKNAMEEMEVILVEAPDFAAYFDEEIAQLNRSRPDTAKGTGSSIAGRTCTDIWACSSEGDNERIRDTLLSDWGNIALASNIR
ncbi:MULTISPECIES: tetratricopeptide repeat protein [Shewanella]|uniref:Sel1 repeat family protein n=1 Tax=Shewanella marisflavi TaxID=260364 RepID=A0AAC9TY15_9GAMM|nr:MULTISPECIES: tetratricopeptide repeat protein [Shewanella]ASJ95549.1 sel1 repeat family protein [Shewanella marisflavi]MCL1041519.1 sel1 repeat family protein [Shewanella marisflavi]QDF74106.1 sel1 repeat family protein [Shewanella marisflavi]